MACACRGFLASKRKDLIHTNKRAAKEFAERPLSYFSMSKERTVWREGGATSAGMPVQTSARFQEPGVYERPHTSSTYISRKRLEDAWAHEVLAISTSISWDFSATFGGFPHILGRFPAHLGLISSKNGERLR